MYLKFIGDNISEAGLDRHRAPDWFGL